MKKQMWFFASIFLDCERHILYVQTLVFEKSRMYQKSKQSTKNYISDVEQ